jgi:ribonucleoside-diphosphate reductase beta chain
MLVIKRTGNTQEFDEEKIKAAVAKAMSRTDYEDDKLQKKVVRYVKDTISGDVIEEIEVDDLHKLVENGIMKAQAYDVAREYVTYRKDNMPDIFRERLTLKPYEYPRLADYVDAIQQSYWIVSEYDFTSDVQDYKSNLTYPEKEAARKSMLAISQVEVAVKKFWG